MKEEPINLPNLQLVQKLNSEEDKVFLDRFLQDCDGMVVVAMKRRTDGKGSDIAAYASPSLTSRGITSAIAAMKQLYDVRLEDERSFAAEPFAQMLKDIFGNDNVIVIDENFFLPPEEP